MLSPFMEELRAHLRTIEDSLRTNEALRELLASREFRPLMFHLPAAQDAALRVKYHALNSTTWRTLDHAAAVTSLYGIYERFVYDLLREWLSQLPAIQRRYSDLQAGVRKHHRLGMASLLQKKEHRRYQHLSLSGILRDLAAASDGAQPCSLLPEAFFSEDENLRREPLETLFARVGMQGTWHWISNHPAIIDFITNVRGGGNTADRELAEFIDYRNDAAHGNIDHVLGLNALLEICAFTESLCEAIVQFVRRALLQGYVDTGRATAVGRITETFQHGAIAIGTMNACLIRVSDQVILIAPDQCPMATVTSLQENDVDRQEVSAAQDQEVGIRFNVKARVNMSIVRLAGENPNATDYSI